MQIRKLIPGLMLLLIAFGCNKKEDDTIKEPPEGCIDLSDLETRQDYYLPFALLNDTTTIQMAILNNETVEFSSGDFIEFRDNGFFELVLKYKNAQQENDTFLFTTKTREREFSEWGIPAWVPALHETELLGQADVEIFYPRRYTDLIKVPFIFYVRESGIVKSIYSEGICPASEESFTIKQGVGSVNIPAFAIATRVDFVVGGKRLNASLSRISETPMELKGLINAPVNIPANSLVKITGTLDITSSGSLSVNEGTVILADEAVDINVSGPITFSGTAENPVFITCSRADKFWGGFITRVAGGTIDAQYTIFCQSGYHDSSGYDWGHSGRQALFYTENSTLSLNHCFITDHIGQIFYPQYSILNLNDILVQRAQTGGQINFSQLSLLNSVFTDFPDDSDIFEDADNDALYLSGSDAEIENTKFMYAKDDGVDSGNEEGGEISFTNCRFEGCFHEGAALSSGGNVVKNHTFLNCVFTNCGQGLELGFSSANHLVIAENCMFLNNGVGIRFGDNYNWSNINGKMIIRNSVSLYNDRDVWNMIRKNWGPKIENISFENTLVSKFCPQYPELRIKEE